MADAIASLRSARATLLVHGDKTALPVARAIDAWLEGGGDFAHALGLAPGWHSALRQRSRDAALRELAQRYFVGLSGMGLARAIVAAGLEYHRRGWEKNRAAGYRPDGRDGLLHDVYIHGGMPGVEKLRKIDLVFYANANTRSVRDTAAS